MFHHPLTDPNMASEPMEHSYSSYSNTSQDSMQSAFSYPGSCPLSIGQPDIPRSQPPFNPYSDSTGPSSYTYTSTDQLSDYSMALSPYTLPITSLSPVDEQQTLSLDMQNHWDPGFEIPVIPDYLQGTGLSLAATSDPSPEPSRPERPFACPTCGNTFTRSADLKRHHTSVHDPIYRDCPVEDCSRKGRNGFPRQDHLNEHIRSYHRIDLPKRRGWKNSAAKTAG